MEIKEAIVGYLYADRIKSELLIASKLLDTLKSIKEGELTGAKKMTISFLEALLGELRIAINVTKSSELSKAEMEIEKAIGGVEMLELMDASSYIGEALSRVTTLGNKSMQVLIENGLIYS
ncbi:MAG TPA: hypothetical protein ENI32_03735 [Candidatus Syntrophoarchaeum butanivorans]|uniref:Uncharacterized protein n=1 Tax=Candidatus Syntropharchaeum butanivorans TaxID=1839936 RepID=A0A7J2S0J1_9EURY|nr:hypothetical protein [Candidatus Syntrophoarchaeum butanivorans]